MMIEIVSQNFPALTSNTMSKRDQWQPKEIKRVSLMRDQLMKEKILEQSKKYNMAWLSSYPHAPEVVLTNQQNPEKF